MLVVEYIQMVRCSEFPRVLHIYSRRRITITIPTFTHQNRTANMEQCSTEELTKISVLGWQPNKQLIGSYDLFHIFLGKDLAVGTNLED